MTKVLLYQLDGKIPNIALMRIAAHHRDRGDEVELRWTGDTRRTLWDSGDETVYASLIFDRTLPKAQRLLTTWPKAILGGSGWDLNITVESIGITTRRQDYSDYPRFPHSLGYTQRGCTFQCWFCRVPQMEGRNHSVGGVYDIWRGDPWPRNLLLLDNDFFGQKTWPAIIEQIKSGGFKVCFNQGINCRTLNDERAAAIASVEFRDDQFKRSRLYTAWDSIGDERPLFRGLEALERHGVKPDSIMVYMLIGSPGEHEDDREYRRRKLREFGCRPYPMPWIRTRELVRYQTWVVGAYDKRVSLDDWKACEGRPERLGALREC